VNQPSIPSRRSDESGGRNESGTLPSRDSGNTGNSLGAQAEHTEVVLEKNDKFGLEIPHKEKSDERQSRSYRAHDPDPQIDNMNFERSRQSDLSTSEKSLAHIPTPENLKPQSNRPVKVPDNSPENAEEADQNDASRFPSVRVNQGRDMTLNRPRTPDGPRNNVESLRSDSPIQRHNIQRDLHGPRQLRYDASRTNPSANVRAPSGFRAPPPTGPRANAMAGMVMPTPNINNSRPQHMGRAAGTVELLRAGTGFAAKPSTPPSERTEQLISPSSSSIAGMNPERAAMLRLSTRDEPLLQRSGTINETRASRTRAPDIAGLDVKGDHSRTNDTPRGPSEWRTRPKRDPQDDDPRRLSRGVDTWNGGGDNSEQRTRLSDEGQRSASTNRAENSTEPLSVRIRPPREAEEKDRPSRESRQEDEKTDNAEGKRTRASVRSDVSDRESVGRTRGPSSTTNQPERLRPTTTSEVKSADSLREREGNEQSAREYKDKFGGKQRESHREKIDVAPSSRDQKNQSSKDQKTSNNRDDESLRRRDDRDVAPRSRRDEARDVRHEHARDSHHGRLSSRRSPSRAHSDRGDKKEKERDREGEGRNGSRRDARDIEHREKERPLRESDHRRDSRDRERSSRDRDPENRRAPRKHERDKSADALDRGSRSGDVGEGSGGGDSTLSIKRRRVVR
jgi:hypothetical protein